jgi:hypothetical protein
LGKKPHDVQNNRRRAGRWPLDRLRLSVPHLTFTLSDMQEYTRPMARKPDTERAISG